MQKAVHKNTPTLPYDDPVLPGLKVTANLEADHIIPIKTITEMPGFNKLSQEDQLKVLNYPDNFVGLSKIANTSKGQKATLTGHNIKKAILLWTQRSVRT